MLKSGAHQAGLTRHRFLPLPPLQKVKSGRSQSIPSTLISVPSIFQAAPGGWLNPGSSQWDDLHGAIQNWAKNPIDNFNLYALERAMPGRATMDNFMLSHEWAMDLGHVALAFASAFCYAGAAACYAAMEAHVAGYTTWLAGGSHEDAFGNMIEAGAIAFVSASANYAIGQGFNVNGANVSAGTRIGNVLAHAALGCAMAEAGGGKCGAGALSGAITAGVDQFDTGSFAGGFAMAMVAGCAGSAAGGGSCSRGAASSALIYLYNACGSPNGCAAIGGAAGTFVGIAASGACNIGTALACGPANGLILGAAIVGGAAAGAAIDSIAVHGNSWLSPSPTTVYQLVYVDSGDLYKYGITDGFNTRYSVNFLTRGGFAMENIATFNSRAPARMLELSLCFGYVAGHGGLPPGSSRC